MFSSCVGFLIFIVFSGCDCVIGSKLEYSIFFVLVLVFRLLELLVYISIVSLFFLFLKWGYWFLYFLMIVFNIVLMKSWYF